MGRPPKPGLETVRRVILAERGRAQKLGWAAAAIAIPGALRWLVDGGVSGFPFVTFFPAVVLAAVLLDWRYATLVALAAGAFSAVGFQSHVFSHLPVHTRLVLAGLYFMATGALVVIGSTLRHTLAELEGLNREQATLSDELRHRFKNMVAVVNALALQTVKTSQSDQFYAVLSGRLDALVKAADILSVDQKACNIQDIVSRAIAPFQYAGRIRIAGPPCEIQAEVCTALMLALHELATNAVKYGALSTDRGFIDITWSFATAAGQLLDLVWIESEGPEVLAPSRTGFGSRLLNMLPNKLGVTRIFELTGVRCDMTILMGR